VPVQGCTLPYSRAIPLLPLWAVWPVQSLSACTRVHFTFTFFIHPFSHISFVCVCVCVFVLVYVQTDVVSS